MVAIVDAIVLVFVVVLVLDVGAGVGLADVVWSFRTFFFFHNIMIACNC